MGSGVITRMRMTDPMSKSYCYGPVKQYRAAGPVRRTGQLLHLAVPVRIALTTAFLVSHCLAPSAQQPPSPPSGSTAPQRPPIVIQAERFLARRGFPPGRRIPPRITAFPPRPNGLVRIPAPLSASASPSAATWQPIGPAAVLTPNFGLVSGRVSAIALDPSDATGNLLYAGTTGGGVWMANNAGTSAAASIVFSPLTDSVTALGSMSGASISIGALAVQPGETGVILAGTGDPNDALDSYYGAGILRSTDGGNTWSLIANTDDYESGLSDIDYSFIGEGFAAFAWSTANPQLVVAAVSQAYEGVVTGADLYPASTMGLYYSSDSGATWHLATITDGAGEVVQGPAALGSTAGGNAATAVVWNPVRQLFVAAVRFHGYYQSSDGITWTRLPAQPGAALTSEMCPANITSTGSVACPIFRGALAVNPQTGDTFAWTVDINDQDQGLWQDPCGLSGGSCTNSSITFATQWSTNSLETSTLQGPVTIADGVYNLALAAVPSQQDTFVLAGANDLWKCSLAMGCVWRNTTNSTSCMSAQVGEFQHALAWSPANPLEIFVGNDSGLWRSTDAVGETGPVCSASDSTHFQNLNGSLGSLAEVESLSQFGVMPDAFLAGLGVNGVAGFRNTAAMVDWPQILSGFGGPVAIDPGNNNNWYVNDQAGVAIYACSQPVLCTPAGFGSSPVVTDADVGGDGYTMSTPAPFLVDPIDLSQLLIATCRVWRGSAGGAGWNADNAISPILDTGATDLPCNGDALIRSIAALPLTNGSEVIYVGLYGSAINGGSLPGHVFTTTFDPTQGAASQWTDLTPNPVVNNAQSFNYFEFDISSLTIDPHDASGNTVYATVEGMPTLGQPVRTIYRSTNGGATWTDITANLPYAPVSGVLVDPQSANTVYAATDAGVFFTAEVGNCAQSLENCWSEFGSGLPGAPAVALGATTTGDSPPALLAATYGRGIWQTPLFTSETAITAAVASPPDVAFLQTPAAGVASSPIQLEVYNTGNLPLTITSIAMAGADPGDFSEVDTCQSPPASAVAAGGDCTINVTFTPQVAVVERTAVMTVFGNVYGGQLTVDLTGTGSATASAVSLTPNPVNFDSVELNTTSPPLAVTLTNNSGAALTIDSITATPPFVISGNACQGTLASLAACQVEAEFQPTQSGLASGVLTVTDSVGLQTVQLSGTGAAAPTDVVSPASLTFAATAVGQLSAPQPVTIANNGGLPLTNISVTSSAQFVSSSNFTTQIPANSTGTIEVQFEPAQIGAISGTLTITDAFGTRTVSLNGTAIAGPGISVSPASLTFANQQPGVSSAPQTLTVSNSGGAPMANVGFAITGAGAASYSIASTTCGAVLNSGSSCTAAVVFTPNGTSVISAALNVTSSTSGVTPVSVPLNGDGQLTAGLATSPSLLNFPVVATGQASPAQTITVTNSSSYAIGALTLATAAPFTIAQNTCTAALAAGANCTASVVFQPTAAGSSSGVLTITSSVVTTPATIALTGTGFSFSVSLSGPTSQTVTAGQQAIFTLLITPSGSSGSFSFACGTLPSNALCLFNPASQSIAAGVQTKESVEISTGSGSSASLVPGLERLAPWRAAPIACGLMLLPFAYRRRSRFLLLVVLALIVTMSIASCTGSGGGTGGAGGNGSGSSTPPGTYSIPVTVTSTGISQAVTLSLTVD